MSRKVETKKFVYRLVRYFGEIRRWSFCHRQYGKGRDKSYVTGVCRHSVCKEVVHFGVQVSIGQYSASMETNRYRRPQGTEVPFVLNQCAKKPSFPSLFWLDIEVDPRAHASSTCNLGLSPRFGPTILREGSALSPVTVWRCKHALLRINLALRCTIHRPVTPCVPFRRDGCYDLFISIL